MDESRFYTLAGMNSAPPAVVSRRVWWQWVRRAAGVLACLLLAVSGVARAAQDQGAPPSAPSSVPAARFARNVVIITIDREIDAVMARSIERRMKIAEENKADAIVFELNTPGGSLQAVLDITAMIKNSSIPNTVAWVHDQAYSGGAIIALACRETVVSGVARMGDAAPVFGASRFRAPRSLKETERQKVLSPLLSDMTDSARRRGYDEKLVQGMVTLGVELWLIENVKTGRRLFIDRVEYTLLFGTPPTTEPLGLAASAPLPGSPAAPPADAPAAAPSASAPVSPTDFAPASKEINADTADAVSLAQSLASGRPDLSKESAADWKRIEKVSDGSTLFTLTEAQLLKYGLASQTIKTDEALQSFFGASNVRRLNESWSESLVIFLTYDLVRGVLVVIMLVSFFIELTHPGVFLPGIVAVAAFALLVAPLLINDMASWWEVAAMLVGILLLLLEVFVIPGFGIAGIAGIILFLVGLVATFIGGDGSLFPGTSGGSDGVLSGITTAALSIVTAIGLMWFIGKNFGSLPFLNRLVLHEVSGYQEEGDLLSVMSPGSSGPVVPGATGKALSPLRPAGRVQVGDVIVNVVSDFGFVPAGAPIRVVSVDQFRITVEPVAELPAPDAGGAGGTGGGLTA